MMISIIFALALVVSFYLGIQYERYRLRKSQEKIRLQLIESYLGLSLKPGETVEELTARAKTFIQDPWKEARENPIWMVK